VISQKLVEAMMTITVIALVSFVLVALALKLARAKSVVDGNQGLATTGFRAGAVARRNNSGNPASAEVKNPWLAKSIVASDCACTAAKSLEGKRFLATEGKIPILPLPQCDAGGCDCRYVTHTDRRSVDDDRRHPNMMKAQLFEIDGGTNRRMRRRGRRKTDWA